MSTLTKPCEVCGTAITKPPSCSTRDWPKRRFCSVACKAKSQKGKVWGRPYGQERATDRPRKFPIYCRICGALTKHSGRRAQNMMHCGSPSCADASRLLKNAKISQGHFRAAAEGRKPPGKWHGMRESKEELLLDPWFICRGWATQFGVTTGRSPRWFRLDFAEPALRLYIELDGDSHRKRRDRDARRDAIMTDLGWKGMRIPAKAVRDDIRAVKLRIDEWIQHITSQATQLL